MNFFSPTSPGFYRPTGMHMTHNSPGVETVGVLGGLGPRASAEFLKTIYEFSHHIREQDSPRVLMLSDPTYPDRTEVLLNGTADALLWRLASDLKKFDELGVCSVVICCITIHHLLPLLPEQLRSLVISLVDTALEGVIGEGRKQLLLCTNGTRRMGIFERNSLWPRAADLIVMPEPRDQEAIHDLIYRLKGNAGAGDLIHEVEALLPRYGVDSFIAGCTEIHLLIREAARLRPVHQNWLYIDPLTILARSIAQGSWQSSTSIQYASAD